MENFAALRYNDFRKYLSIRFFFTLASQMQTTVIGFYVYQLTHSKIAIAFIGLSEVIPALGLALYGGYITDKCEKRGMLLILFSIVLFSSLVLLVVTSTPEGQTPHITRILSVIYTMLFCNGVARAFYEPALFSVYAQSVPREAAPNANNWSNLSWQSASILGPMTGGFIYGYASHLFPGIGGITAAFTGIFLFLILSLIGVCMLPNIPGVLVPKEGKRDSFFAGLRFVLKTRMMFYAMALDLFSVFFGGVTALLPVYAIDILHIGPEGLGLMRMAASLGAALTMIALVRFSPMNKPWRNLLVAVGGFGCSIIGFGLSHSFFFALLFLFAQGAFDSVSVMIRGTILQLLTPEQMRGRVSAVNSMFIGSSAEIGDFESGMMANLLGTIPAVLFGGCMTLLIVIFVFVKTKKFLSRSISDIRPSGDQI